MGSCSNDGEVCLKLLDLISKKKDLVVVVNRGEEQIHGCSDDRNLELKLGPPGICENSREKSTHHESVNSKGYNFSFMTNNNNINGSSFSQPSWYANGSSFLQPTTHQSLLPVMAKESSLPCSKTETADLQTAEIKSFSQATVVTAVPNTSQKRTAPGPVVGWPPIRSFRKNLASTSKENSPLKPNPDSQNKKIPTEKQVENCSKGLFIKINMDGIPIGRKVDLKAYDSYDKLSKAVDQLFRNLLIAQRDSSAGGSMKCEDDEKLITGVLGGRGEYTLVYEDNEGDRMLVGDVPWHMFVTTVKRLRVLKSCEVSALCLSSGKQVGRQLE